jgi:hypothetical protein
MVKDTVEMVKDITDKVQKWQLIKLMVNNIFH